MRIGSMRGAGGSMRGAGAGGSMRGAGAGASMRGPGGSMRDEEVIKAADQHNIAMVFTGVRHFRH